MKTLDKTKLIEATIAATAIIGVAAAVVTANAGAIAAGILIVGTLAAMVTLDVKKRAY